jgi:hypothetical protein
MTRNTKFYKITATINNEKKDIYYKDLTTIEMSVLNNIKNEVVRKQMAAELSVYNIDPEIVPFPIKLQIGEDILFRSGQVISDKDILDITVQQFRTSIKDGDPVLSWLSHLTRFYPGTSINDFLHMNYKDLIELVVLGEEMTNTSVFGSKKKGVNLVNPNNLEDGGKALREQIRTLNNSIGIK